MKGFALLLNSLRILHNNQNKTNSSVTLVDITLRTAYFCKLGNITKKRGVSVAHIADDIQKQSKTFYQLIFLD
jgi:hypothetical protein